MATSPEMTYSNTIEKNQALLVPDAAGDRAFEDFKPEMIRSMKRLRAGTIKVFDDIEYLLAI